MATIETLTWGEMTVSQGKKQVVGKDLILTPEHVISWDWSVTDLHHQPGVRVVDLEAVNSVFPLANVNMVIISRGMQNKLMCTLEATNWLDERHIPWLNVNTNEAVTYYNQAVSRGELVVGLFHTTC